MLNNIIILSVGAAFGASLRWLFGLWFAHSPLWLSAGTLAANWTGAYLIGLLAELFAAFPSFSPHWKLLLITGFLGSLTTLSGLSLEIVGQLQQHRLAAAFSTAALHLAGSLLLTYSGILTVQALR
ncbi:CrcB family protein [Neisseria sp.]|uniref:CrcB family protein n=1 Tax=Neisseria sp. TaxID=192066 RepID=UPI00359FFB90